MTKTDAIFPVESTSPLNAVIKTWKIFLQDQGKSIYTVKSFIGDLELLAKFLPVDQTVDNISTENLESFLDWLQKERGIPCSPKSFSRRITSIKSFFRWLFNFGRLSINPAEKIIQKTVISPLPAILTESEQKEILETAESIRRTERPDSRPYLLFSLLISTGIKKGECLSIHLNHIDTDASNNPTLFVRYSNPSNRFKERKIKLTQEWVNAFSEYLDQYTPRDLLFPWSPRRLEYILEELGEKVNLNKHLSFDMCRWTSAVNDWKESSEKDFIRQKLGVSKMQWREISNKLSRLTNSIP